jgi:hypothetical protein
MQLNIQLSAEECAAIVGVLGNLPYRQVAGLIGKIEAQAAEQKRLADEVNTNVARDVATDDGGPE